MPFKVRFSEILALLSNEKIPGYAFTLPGFLLHYTNDKHKKRTSFINKFTAISDKKCNEMP